MTDFSELAFKRRSIRKYTGEKLTEDEVVELMKPALTAPSSKNKQSWEFVLVDDPNLLHQLSECRSLGTKFIKDAPLAIVVCGNAEISDIWVEDAAIAATHLLLQAESLGLGACWAQVHNRFQDDGTSAEQMVGEIIGLPQNIKPLCMIGVGRKLAPKEAHDSENLPWEKLHFNNYEQK